MPTLGASFGVHVLRKVGEVTVASYRARGFERLSASERALAYHLSAAALAGDSLFTRQTSRFALPAQRLVRSVLAAAQREDGTALQAALHEKLREYRRSLFVHHGLHDSISSRKVPPPLTLGEFQQALEFAHAEAPAELLAAMFDPSVQPLLVNKAPTPGKDPLRESAANHYEGLSSQDLVNYREQFELNGRLVKRGDHIEEQVYRAGDAHTPPGLGARVLGRMIAELQAAVTLAPSEQQRALSVLIRYLQTGDPALRRQHDVLWLAQSFRVDYVFGFLGTYLDVRERKGNFTSFVCIGDPDFDPPLKALASAAAYFEDRLPWPAAYKRNLSHIPAAGAVTTLAATGAAGPITFGGVNLPDERELQEHYGTKTLLNVTAEEVRREVGGTAIIDEFAPEEERSALRRCRVFTDQTFVGLHEIKGHGSGQVEPTLATDPMQALAPYYGTLEEARADLAADYLALDPKTIEIQLLPDLGCANAYPSASVLRLVSGLLRAPVPEPIEGDHLRAALLQLGFLRDRGAIRTERRQGRTFLVVKDSSAWRAAVAELLTELQRIKATGDQAAIAALVTRYATRIDPALHTELQTRRPKQSLAEYIAIAPPLLAPIRGPAGQVIDARAEQPLDLDLYIDAIERASDPQPWL